jgi:hypothetical protein
MRSSIKASSAGSRGRPTLPPELDSHLEAAVLEGAGGGPAAVGGGDGLDDGQAEAGAAVGAGAVGLQAPEGLEQGGDLVGGMGGRRWRPGRLPRRIDLRDGRIERDLVGQGVGG